MIRVIASWLPRGEHALMGEQIFHPLAPLGFMGCISLSLSSPYYWFFGRHPPFFKMFQISAGATKSANTKKVLSPALRPDIYTLVDQTKSWMIGHGGSSNAGQPGDGLSYKSLFSTIQKHFPNTPQKPGMELHSQAEGEIAIVVGGVTNMILELSKWEGMAAGMAMRTWVDGLVEAHSKASQKTTIAQGVSRGLGQFTDASLLTKDFTTRIQIISCLKTGEHLRFLAWRPPSVGSWYGDWSRSFSVLDSSSYFS